MKQKLKKVISYNFYIVIAILLIAILCSGIFAMDVGHLECCKVQDCSLCQIIQSAIDIAQQIFGIVIYIYILDLIIPLTYNLVYDIKLNIKRDTLVKLQVQHNE